MCSMNYHLASLSLCSNNQDCAFVMAVTKPQSCLGVPLPLPHLYYLFASDSGTQCYDATFYSSASTMKVSKIRHLLAILSAAN